MLLFVQKQRGWDPPAALADFRAFLPHQTGAMSCLKTRIVHACLHVHVNVCELCGFLSPLFFPLHLHLLSKQLKAGKIHHSPRSIRTA